jgi:predicted esterase
MKFYFYMFLVFFVSFCSFSQEKDIKSGRNEQVLNVEINRKIIANYLLYLPKQYFTEKKDWPLIMFLHGGEGRGNDLKKLNWYRIPKMLEKNDSLPFIVISPQCPAGEMWTDAELLMTLLNEVIKKYSVDTNRIYLTGYSMGGNGAWYLAYKYPEKFAAVAPMSGVTITWWASRLKNIPIWAFHGLKDNIVQASETEKMVKAIKDEGGNVRFSLDSNESHSPPDTNVHYALFDWFLTHKRNSKDTSIYSSLPAKVDPKKRYIFYIHGRIIEMQGAAAVSNEYGRYEYDKILQSLSDKGFTVISEIRPDPTDVRKYAEKIVNQINTLLAQGVPPNNITVVGASKGGIITICISNLLKNKNVNFVLMACCNEMVFKDFEHELWGNILSIYDYKDVYGQSCNNFYKTSPGVNKYKEIKLEMGIGHGLLYHPYKEWIEPVAKWGKENK